MGAIVRKASGVLLAMILAFATVASSVQKIEDIPWDESHIKQLRAFHKAAVLHFDLQQEDQEDLLSASDFSAFDFHWYQAGDGKYELAIDSQTGPDIAHLDIYWKDAPGKFRLQTFGFLTFARCEQWYEGTEFADLNGDGKEELILFEPLDSTAILLRRKFIPNATWPKVYRLRDGKYVDTSRDFADFYLKKILPQLDKAIVKAANANAPPWSDPSDNDWQLPDRNLAALIMCRDKILRVIGRDPTAGLAQARKWMRDSDPVMVDDARIVLQDMGGHDEELRAAKTATERASNNWPNKNW
jgi:hypothetical protein